MATDPLLRSELPVEPSEAEYRIFCDTVMATGRGRWFLAEYARRHRKATTQDALDTLTRIEGRLRGARNETAHIFEELRSLAATIHHARLDIGWSDSEFSKGAKVMALLELLEDRIAGLVEDSANDLAPVPEDKAEPRVQLTVIAANPLPPRARAELPAIDFTGEATVVTLPQALATVFTAERAQETAQTEAVEIEIAIAAELPAPTLAFPAVALFQPFEVEKTAAVDVAVPVDFVPEPFDAEAIAPQVFDHAAEQVFATPAEPVVEAPGDIELFDPPAVVQPAQDAEPEPALAPEPAAVAAPVADEQPVVAPRPVVARRQLPPGYDPMTPVRALSTDERIALVS
jgi:hypothetical protein